MFPQDGGGSDEITLQVPLDELGAQVAKLRATQASYPAHLSIIGCLTYRFAGNDIAHATGFVGDLYQIAPGPNGPTTLYDMLVAGTDAAKVSIKVDHVSFWAD